jgi:hypothetical protein
MKKVIRDGKVAVLYSPGYGAGWSTWGNEAMMYDPEVVALVEADRRDEIEALYQERYGENTPYCGGAEQLQIEWLPVGTEFRIKEYDGSESIEIKDEVDWNNA